MGGTPRPSPAPDASRNTAGPGRAPGKPRASFGLHGPGRAGCPPQSSPLLPPRAALLAEVQLEVLAKILERALQGLGGARRQRAVGVARSHEARDVNELVEIRGLALSFFDGSEQPGGPAQAAPAGRTPAAGFLGEKALQVPHHADRAGLVVENNHGACAQAAAHFLDFVEIQLDVEVLLDQEIGGRASWKEPAHLQPVAHAAGKLQDLSLGRSERELPQARARDLATQPVKLRPAVGRAAEAFEPLRPILNDVWDV